jgi:serine acetyltransferase
MVPRSRSAGRRIEVIANIHGNMSALEAVLANTERSDGATIIGGVTVGENSVVAAGSVVLPRTFPHTLVVGNPARVGHSFRRRGLREHTQKID